MAYVFLRPFLRLLLLASLGFAMSAPTSRLRPGAVVDDIGTVFVTEDAVTVSYDLERVFSFRSDYEVLSTRIHQLQSHVSTFIPSDASDSSRQIFNLARSRMAKIRATLEKFASLLPDSGRTAARHAHAHRARRGLFNFVGQISHSLFGTAQASDVESLGERLSVLEQGAGNANRLLELESKQIREVDRCLATVISTVNNVTSVVNVLSTSLDEMTHLTYLLAFVDALNDDVNTFVAETDVVLSNLVDAALGRVTPMLLPLEHLVHAIDIGKERFKLDPMFDSPEAEFYYPLLGSFLTLDSILISIPFRSSLSLNVYHVLPFPFPVNDSLYVIVDVPELVLISKDLSVRSSASYDSLGACKSSYLGLYVCPAFLFSFVSVSQDMCEFTLTQTQVREAAFLKDCTYSPAPRKEAFHVHASNVNYFFFPNSTHVSLLCYGKRTSVMAQGFYQAPDICEVRSAPIRTLPSRQHSALLLNFTSSFSPISLDFVGNDTDLSLHLPVMEMIEALNVTNMDYFVATNLPMFVRPHVMYSIILVPMVVLFVIAVVGFLALRSLWMRVGLLVRRRRAKLQTSEQGTGTSDDAAL